jgi:hypothetical protein
MNGVGKFRLQSAMEYLMTYGWAILIIAVVLGVLYYLGIFNGAASLGTACIPVAGYLCQTPSMTSNGLLSFTLGQNTAGVQYNVALACAQVSNGQGLPVANSGPWFYVQKTGNVINAGNGINYTDSISLTPGEQISVTGLTCFGTTGTVFNPGSIGAQFSGTLWYNYTATSTNSPAANALIVKMGTITIKTS